MNSPFFVFLNVNVLVADSKREMNGNHAAVVVVMVIIEKSKKGRMFSVSVNLDSRDTQTLCFDDAQRVEGTRQEYNSRPCSVLSPSRHSYC